MITMQRGPQPAGFTDVRATNLAVVLRYVRNNFPCSRAEIATETGLNKATVSSLVVDLIERQLVREIGFTENRIGRPATMLTLDGAPYAAVGMEVNADHLSVVAVDLVGQQVLTWRRAFAGLDSTPNQAAAAIAALSRRAVARLIKDGRKVLGLTVGVPGLVDAKGVVKFAPNLGWQELNLRETLGRALGEPDYPVNVDNDANLAVLAESRYGSHAGAQNLICVTGEVGIGAGIISDDRVIRGSRGFPGEIGHLTVEPEGPVCGCGRRGCLEVVAGIGAIIAKAMPDAASDGRLVDLQPEVEEVVRRASQGDRVTVAALTDAGRALGAAVSVVANLLDPEVVVLGGYFAPLAPWLLPPAQEEVVARSVAPQECAQLVASTLGLNATAAGGAANILDYIDSGNLPKP